MAVRFRIEVDPRTCRVTQHWKFTRPSNVTLEGNNMTTTNEPKTVLWFYRVISGGHSSSMSIETGRIASHGWRHWARCVVRSPILWNCHLRTAVYRPTKPLQPNNRRRRSNWSLTCRRSWDKPEWQPEGSHTITTLRQYVITSYDDHPLPNNDRAKTDGVFSFYPFLGIYLARRRARSQTDRHECKQDHW